jgi:hypothetical protein
MLNLFSLFTSYHAEISMALVCELEKVEEEIGELNALLEPDEDGHRNKSLVAH